MNTAISQRPHGLVTTAQQGWVVQCLRGQGSGTMQPGFKFCFPTHSCVTLDNSRNFSVPQFPPL